MNIFSKIAAASKSPFLEQVEQLRRDVEALPVYTEVKVANATQPITVWMRRGFEGSDFTYLVTDGTPTKGEASTRRNIDGGSFTLEIIETMKRLHRLIITVRPGFDPTMVMASLRDAKSTRNTLRSVSKTACDEEREIEMVIKRV